MAHRPTHEEARSRIIVPGDPPRDAEPVEPQGTRFDKTAPKGPPTPEERRVPEWFQDVYAFIKNVVDDEGLVLDLSLERAIQIVEFNHNRGMAGIDFFPEAGGGQSVTRAQMVAIAAPLACELYKQALTAIRERKEDFEKLVEAAVAKKVALEGK